MNSNERILLLNVTMEPLQIISPREAVSLMMKGRAIPAEGTSTPVAKDMKTVSTSYPVPSVLRLQYYVKMPNGLTWSKRNVLWRDNYTCIYCGLSASEVSKSEFSVDHIIPKAQGGKNTWGNTACSCKKCNQRKADRTPTQSGMKLRWEPKHPRSRGFVVTSNMPHEWKKYIRLGKVNEHDG